MIDVKNKAVSFTKETVDKIKSDKKKRIIATIVITALILFIGLGTVMYYIAGPAEGYMTSDSTDSLEWAEEYRITGDLVSKEYNYAAILPFGGNQIFLPFLAIFGYSMEAQIGGMLTFAVIFCAALMYLARGLGLGWFSSAGVSSAMMLLLSSGSKLREIMWEHIFYYNLGILYFCVGFGLVIRILKDIDKITEDKKIFRITAVRICCLFVFCVLASTGGFQALVCLTLPLVLGLALKCMLKSETPIFSQENKWNLMLIGEILVFSLMGMGLLFIVSNGVRAGYAEGHYVLNSVQEMVNGFLRQIPNWFTLCGVDYTPGKLFLSMDAFVGIMKVFVAATLLVVPIVQLKRYSKIESQPLKLLLLGHVVLMSVLLFACTFGAIGSADWRLTPMLGTSCIITLVSLIDFLKSKGILKRVGVIFVSIVLLGCFTSFVTIWSMPADYGEDNNWHMVVDELEKRDLKYGYATFWWANLTKMIAGNGMQIACVGIDGQGLIYQEHYQTRKDAYEDKDTDRYFVIFSESEYPHAENWINQQKETGAFVEEIMVESEEYNHKFYSGTKSYIIVVNQNPF